MDRLRGRADEQQLRLLVAVLVVERQVDFHRLVAVRAQVLERGVERGVEAAADLAGPAREQHQLLLAAVGVQHPVADEAEAVADRHADLADALGHGERGRQRRPRGCAPAHDLDQHADDVAGAAARLGDRIHVEGRGVGREDRAGLHDGVELA